MSATVLKLDCSFRPLALIPWHEAIRLLYLDKATVVEQLDDEFWCSPSVQVPKPLVIQVKTYVRLRPNKNNGMAIKSILYARDLGCCQYCGTELSMRQATKDHVVPRSRGESLGMTKQEINGYCNLVIACKACNTEKADKLCWEIGMYPRTTPKVPEYINLFVRGVECKLQRQYIQHYYRLPDDPNEEAEEILD